jgi:hypothetical protein
MPPDSSVEEEGNKKQKLQKWLDQNQYTRYRTRTNTPGIDQYTG